MRRIKQLFTVMLIAVSSLANVVYASSASASTNLTHSWVGFSALAVFILAYLLVMLEEKIELKKSKPVMLAAGVIWVLIAITYRHSPNAHEVEAAIETIFVEFAELFFFLLVAMTYINTLLERGVFATLRTWLVKKRFSYRALFWITGCLAFVLSPIMDNLTTALILCTVVVAVGKGRSKFIGVSCVNIVVGANAGGAFSPFGDITTLMVWQNQTLTFTQFFPLFVPSLVNFLVPALIMQFFVGSGLPAEMSAESKSKRELKQGGVAVIVLFLATIITAVCFHMLLHIPPVFGMITGLAYLKLYSYYLFQKHHKACRRLVEKNRDTANAQPVPIDSFSMVSRAEWDTLFFFYGVIMAVGGLGFIGYLDLLSAEIYGQLGPTAANSLVGVLSAVIDNIPVMYAVLTMQPEMSEAQWQLITLTAGVGGSLLSIGSAAGVALMGQAREHYTFLYHLKWTPVIALGYILSIACHIAISGY